MKDTPVTTRLRGIDILREMRQESDAGDARQRPNVISYNTVMNGWAQKGNHERVSEVLRLMYDDFTKGNKDVKPDLVCYNLLMLAHQRSKDKDSWARAFALLEHMKKLANAGVLDVQPDAYTMSTGKLALASYVIFTMSLGSDIVLIEHRVALSCLSNSKENLTEAAMKATEILNNMRESYESGNSRLQPNSHCYNTVLDAWASQGNPIKAEEVFLLMCNDLSRGNSAAKPLTSTYNSKFQPKLSNSEVPID
jgi:pentatricopeptide repeat protein